MQDLIIFEAHLNKFQKSSINVSSKYEQNLPLPGVEKKVTKKVINRYLETF